MRMLIDDVERIIEEKPGSTATELALTLYGRDGYQEQINPSLRTLCSLGRIQRCGIGGHVDPYRYFPAQWTRPNDGRKQNEKGPTL
jgi:hypothetical protein